MYSKALLETSTTFHPSENYLLRATVASMRASFALMGINVMRWIARVRNVADALLKWNVKILQDPNYLIVAGLWKVDRSGGPLVKAGAWIRLNDSSCKRSSCVDWRVCLAAVLEGTFILIFFP